ncbi:L-asparaginase [Enterobacter sp. 10-1]|nr:L-asparaginase [Enterobacter sp. 10-1]
MSCLCACKEYRAILLAIFNLGCARPCHVLRVRSSACAQSALKLAATITPWL